MKNKLKVLLAILTITTAFGVASACSFPSADSDSDTSSVASSSSAPEKKKTYTVRFTNEDHTIISERVYEEGAMPEIPADPTFEGEHYTYVFKGWDKEVTAVEDDVIYKAVYVRTAHEYTIIFKIDGEQVGEPVVYTLDDVEIEEPALPARQDYDAKWEKYKLDGGNKEVNAVYTPTEYTITFVDEEGNPLLEPLTYTMQDKENFTFPEIPESLLQPGYTVAWDKTTDDLVSCDLVVSYTKVERPYILTLDAKGFEVSTNVLNLKYGDEYVLPTPSIEYRTFLGWYDEVGNKIDTEGVWTIDDDLTLTAEYSKISFEDGVVPSYMTTETSMSVVDMATTDGDKALKIDVTSTTAALKVPFAFLASFFTDESVDYIAFEARTSVTKHSNFRRTTWRSNNGGEFVNVKYEADNDYTGIDSTAFKTFYFTRTDYEKWIEYNADYKYFVSAGNLTAGESVYVDNIRAATAEEYTASIHSLETDQWRADGNNLFFYTYPTLGTWQWCITQGTALPAYGWTNEKVTDGNRAFTFTLTADVESTFRFNSASVQFAQDIYSPTGYYAFDLYVPEGANAKLTASIGGGYPNSLLGGAGWRTVYSNSTTFMKLTDTTGSTYAIDNFRSVTAEEYEAATLGFESGTGGIRQLESDGNVFYYYMNNGVDSNNNRASLNFNGGTSVTVSNPCINGLQAHSGEGSLSFDKTEGVVGFGMHAESQMLAMCKKGLTFWIYSTVELTSADVMDGKGVALLAADEVIAANTWTQITITEEGLNGATYFRLGGGAGTIYVDDYAPLA